MPLYAWSVYFTDRHEDVYSSKKHSTKINTVILRNGPYATLCFNHENKLIELTDFLDFIPCVGTLGIVQVQQLARDKCSRFCMLSQFFILFCECYHEIVLLSNNYMKKKPNKKKTFHSFSSSIPKPSELLC